ncbi:MAG: lipopolysaccharide kinase InaA family protein, partial [Acidobacteriota bacterium]
KAERSWRRALDFVAAGVPTAEPLLWIESAEPEGPSFFVCRHLPRMLEARVLFRAMNAGEMDRRFPGLDGGAFLDALGRGLRRMHEAGLFHRDLSIGNVLMAEEVLSPQPDDLFVIDLNRARVRPSLSSTTRTRDLCRLAIFRPADRRRFWRAYWQGEATAWRWWLYRLYQRSFLFKIEGKKKIRAPLKGLGWLKPRRTHPHLESAPTGAGAREKIVWDPLSDQPHQHASRLEKTRVRLADAPGQLRNVGLGALAAPRIWRRYRRLEGRVFAEPTPWRGAGICLRPFPEAPDELLGAVDDLGLEHVLVRLHPWQKEHDEEEALVRELDLRGYEIVYSLPQNRELIRDPALWRRRVAELAERFSPYGKVFQVGQAINRSKWGVWRYGEYLELARSAVSILKEHPGVEAFGPAVIDFEPYATASVVNLPECPRFDGLASLLYVDRRGAPEGRQLGFDTLGKALLCRAIAETSRRCGPRSWVTEVNWPLREGPHSPAGKKVSVDETAQADYLARYYLWTLATGAAERVYWWQMIARGYGLIAPRDSGGEVSGLRRRPAFDALRTLESELRGYACLGALPAPEGCHLLSFRRGDERTVVGWASRTPSSDGGSHGRRVRLLEAPRGLREQDGRDGERPSGRDVDLLQSVRFFRI